MYKVSQDKLNRKKALIHPNEVTVKIVHWWNYYAVCRSEWALASVCVFTFRIITNDHTAITSIYLSIYLRLTNSKITYYIARLSSRLAWQYNSTDWYTYTHTNGHSHMKQVCKLSTTHTHRESGMKIKQDSDNNNNNWRNPLNRPLWVNQAARPKIVNANGEFMCVCVMRI